MKGIRVTWRSLEVVDVLNVCAGHGEMLVKIRRSDGVVEARRVRLDEIVETRTD